MARKFHKRYLVRAQEIRLHVVEANSSESIPFATIAVEYCDTIIGSMTDTEGAYSFTPRSLPLNLKVSGFGMEESSMSISTIPDSLVTVKLQPGSIELHRETYQSNKFRYKLQYGGE